MSVIIIRHSHEALYPPKIWYFEHFVWAFPNHLIHQVTANAPLPLILMPLIDRLDWSLNLNLTVTPSSVLLPRMVWKTMVMCFNGAVLISIYFQFNINIFVFIFAFWTPNWNYKPCEVCAKEIINHNKKKIGIRLFYYSAYYNGTIIRTIFHILYSVL